MQTGGFIHIGEVMQMIRSGKAFSITWVKADRKRKTGGEIKTMVNAILSKFKDDGTAKAAQPALDKPELTHPAVAIHSKNPNHFENDTLNVRKRGTQTIKKVHVNLITVFNGKPVID